MQRALITGVAGQDGHYLARLLVARGLTVLGVSRRSVTIPGVASETLDVTDREALRELIARFQPDACYHLAAYHRSSAAVGIAQSDEEATYLRVNLLATHDLLRSLRELRPGCRVFIAGSCHMFGDVETSPQDESTPFRPNSPYGITKVAAWGFARLYRQRGDLRTSLGILYNHESPLRGPSFLSTRIAQGAVAVARAQTDALVVGNLDSQVDWGFAGDYAEAMVRIVEADEPDEYVVASGSLHTVRDFVTVAFDRLGLDWRQHVRQRADVYRPVHAGVYHGDIAKIRRRLGWEPRTDFETLVATMVDHQRGETAG